MASRSNGEQPSEASPLLPKKDRALSRSSLPPIDPSAGIAPEGADSRGVLYGDTLSDESDNASNAAIDNQDDLERQISRVSSVGRAKQFEGLPEVKKKLKYIYPAVAIGVGFAANLVWRVATDRRSCRYSSLLPTRR